MAELKGAKDSDKMQEITAYRRAVTDARTSVIDSSKEDKRVTARVRNKAERERRQN